MRQINYDLYYAACTTDRTDMCHITYFGHCAADRYCWVRDCMSTIRTQCHTSIAPLNITAVTGCHKLHTVVLTVRSHKQISKTHTTPRLTASVLSHYPTYTCYLLMYELCIQVPPHSKHKTSLSVNVA
jgi:hypothetical protein